MSVPPHSRDYQEDVDEAFDQDVLSITKLPLQLTFPPKFKKWMVSKIDPMLVDNLTPTVNFLLDKCAQRVCSHAFEKYGLNDVLCLLRCSVNPYLAIMCELNDVPTDEVWKIVMRTIPSRGGGSDGVHMSSFGLALSFRSVTEIDRGSVGVGPSQSFTTPEGIVRKAFIDLMSCAADEEEYIIFGSDNRYTVLTHHGEYGMHTHVDSPDVKTCAQHYRLYYLYGSIKVGHMVLDIPIPTYRMLRLPGPHANILMALPYACDLQALIFSRPSITNVVTFLVYHVCMGLPIVISGHDDLMRQVDAYGYVDPSRVFIDTLYKRTPYTELNHGGGRQWKTLYDKMFQ